MTRPIFILSCFYLILIFNILVNAQNLIFISNNDQVYIISHKDSKLSNIIIYNVYIIPIKFFRIDFYHPQMMIRLTNSNESVTIGLNRPQKMARGIH